MKYPRLLIIAVIAVGLVPLIVGAAMPRPPSAEAVASNPDLFSWVVGLCFFVICALGGYIARTADKVSQRNHENNRKQWEKLDDHESRLTRVEVKYDMQHGGQS